MLHIYFIFIYIFAAVVCVAYCVCPIHCVFCVCGVFLCESTELSGIFGLKSKFIIIIIVVYALYQHRYIGLQL